TPSGSTPVSLPHARPIIDPASGVFTWTPTEAQGPSTNLLRVIVTDSGTPALSATQAFTIVVNEVNSAPTLNPLASLTNNELSLVTFTATATDPDIPANGLSYSLLNPPAGASINAVSGLFTWKPTEAQIAREHV